MGKLHLRLLGTFRLEDSNGTPVPLGLRKAEALLAYLAVAEGHSTSRERLAALLWGEFAQARARQSLRQALLGLTKRLSKLDQPILRLESQTVSLNADALSIDALAFSRLVAEGTPDSLEKAADLYKGEFLEGVGVDAPDFDSWLMTERGRYHDLAMRAFTELLNSQEKGDQIEAAIDTAHKALRIDPIREDIHRSLMALYERSGRRSSAISQFRQCRDVLQRELGVEPDAETSALYRTIVDQRVLEPGAGDATPSAVDRSQAQEHSEEADLPEMPGGSILVGRQQELAFLQNLHDQAAKSHGQCVILRGEAGVGKTHLLDSFVNRLHDAGLAPLLFRARRAERHLSFGIVSDILDRLLEAGGEALLEELQDSSRQALARLNRGFAHPQQDQGISEPDRRSIYAAVIDLLGCASAGRVCVWILEDMQWADNDSLSLFAYLARHIAELPVFLLSSLRTEDQRRQPLLAEVIEALRGEKAISLLELQPLSQGETAELLYQLRMGLGLQPDEPERDGQIWLLSEGNPRVAIEGLLADLSGSAGEVPPVPDEVLRDTQRQLARFSEAARQVVRTASVIGEDITADLLTAASGLNDEALADATEELIAAGVLRVESDRYQFLRNRDRLAVYQDIAPARRKILHGAVVDGLKRIHEGALEAVYPRLAQHSQAAGDLMAAVGYEQKSAEAELQRGYPGRAQPLLEKALKTAQAFSNVRDPEVCRLQADIHLGLAEVADMGDRRAAVAAALTAAEEVLKTVRDPARLARLRAAQARLEFQKGNLEKAYFQARGAFEQDELAGGANFWLLPDRLMTRLHLSSGPLAGAAARLMARRDRARDLGLVTQEAEVSAALGLLYAAQGDFHNADRESEYAISVAENSGHEICLAACFQFRGIVQTWHGALESALGLFGQSAHIAESRGDLGRLYVLKGFRGAALLAGEQFGEAAEELDRAIDLSGRLGTRFLLPFFLVWRAEAALGSGEEAAALALCQDAFLLAGETNQPWAQSLAYRALARAFAQPQARDLYRAEKAIRSAMDAQNGLGLNVELAHSALVHAKILRARGNANQSSEAFSGASRRFEEMGMVLEGERARVMAAALKPTVE